MLPVFDVPRGTEFYPYNYSTKGMALLSSSTWPHSKPNYRLFTHGKRVSFWQNRTCGCNDQTLSNRRLLINRVAESGTVRHTVHYHAEPSFNWVRKSQLDERHKSDATMTIQTHWNNAVNSITEFKYVTFLLLLSSCIEISVRGRIESDASERYLSIAK